MSGGCVEGAAAEEIERARADGHARVIRYGISDEQAWDVGPRLRRDDRRARRAGVPGRRSRPRARRSGRRQGAAVVTPLPADAPPARVRAATSRATARRPSRRARRRTTTAGSRARSASPTVDAQLVDAAREALLRGHVAHGRARRPLALRRGVPGPAAARGRRRGRGRPVARPARARARATRRSSSTAGRRSRPPERFPDVDRLIVGWPDEVADEIGLGPNDAVAVLTHDVKFDEPAIVEALRRGCRYVGAVGVEEDAGRPARAAARGGRQRRRAGPAARPDRARPGRPGAGRDGARDPRRGRRRALRRERRPAPTAGGRLT